MFAAAPGSPACGKGVEGKTCRSRRARDRGAEDLTRSKHQASMAIWWDLWEAGRIVGLVGLVEKQAGFSIGLTS